MRELTVNGYFTRREPSVMLDYEQAYWGTVVDPDGNVRNRLQEREKHLEDIKQELDFLNALPPGRILDVGCGLGFLLSGFGPGWEKYGVELSQFAAEHARQYCQIFIGELGAAKYPSEYFDVVVLHHVIEHMDDPVAAIHEVARVLRPGGQLLIGTPDFDSGCARRFGEKYRLLHDPTHVSLFSNESMHRFLRDHGFVIDRVEYPFFGTRYFTRENLLRLFDTDQVSPPFYGNFMTFYCHKPAHGRAFQDFMELSRLAAQVAETIDQDVMRAGDLIAACLSNGGKVLVCGNGGSAADAQHFVAELVGRMSRDREALGAISLSSDPSVVTALGNDYGFEQVFARQIEGLGRTGDTLLIISTSGRSPNVLNALLAARARGLSSIALIGGELSTLTTDCDCCISVPANNAQHVQEIHMPVLHCICVYVEQYLMASAMLAKASE